MQNEHNNFYNSAKLKVLITDKINRMKSFIPYYSLSLNHTDIFKCNID